MEIQVLGPSSALSPGAHIWILTAPSESRWARLVDWYLNLQVLQYDSHQPPQQSPQLKNILDACEIPNIEFMLKPNPPLMVSSHRRLPNSETIFLHCQSQIEKWLFQSQAIWEQMLRPSVRLFMPPAVHIESVEKVWKSQGFFLPLEIVPEVAS